MKIILRKNRVLIDKSYRFTERNYLAFASNDKKTSFKKKIQSLLSKKRFWGFLVILLSLLAVILYFLFVLYILQTSSNLLIERSSWDNNPNRTAHNPMTLPIQRIIMTFTDDQTTCVSSSKCIDMIRSMHIKYSRQFGDIPFNFIIGDDGHVYEGRGFNQQGLIVREDYLPHTDNSGLVIAFIGNYSSVKPNERQQSILREFLEQFVSLGVMDIDYTVLSQSSINMDYDGEFTKFLIDTFEPQYFERKSFFDRRFLENINKHLA